MDDKDGPGVRKTQGRTFRVAREDILGSPASEGASLSLITRLLSASAWFWCSIILG